MQQEYKTYQFVGTVVVGGVPFARNAIFMTWAPSEEKAKSNIIFRCREKYDLSFASPVELIGSLDEIPSEDKTVDDFTQTKLEMQLPIVAPIETPIQLKMDI